MRKKYEGIEEKNLIFDSFVILSLNLRIVT